jgi:VWFA-related protein
VRRLSGSSMTLVRLAAAICAVAAVAAQQQPPPATEKPAGAQQPAQQQAQTQPPPRFKTEANYVRVDAYPTKDGQPVQDLRLEDFEVLENGARQQVQAFEHIVISPAGPQSLRVEPGSVRAGEQAAANPRNRVFVFFLDIPNVSFEASRQIVEPLIRFIDRVLGPDDLIAVMTTAMSANQIAFGRKTEVVADMLRNKSWGERHFIVPMDNREVEYSRCYPYSSQEGLVQQMIARRRERMALDSLHDLVRYLGSIREERKAIVAISEGWLLYTPDPSMTMLRSVGEGTEPVPGVPPVGVDERGKLRINPPPRTPDNASADQTVCDRERMYLANIDDEDYMRQLYDLANRNNASFYPVDPRGLAVFDYPIGPKRPPSITVDQSHLMQRIQVLRTLAENTDGMAVVNSNDLDRGLRRMADDLTSYYLLGYYSTNTRLDGQYRKITVRVKRPGVEVRARRGYRAPTTAEVNASMTAAAAPVPDNVRTANAAVATLARIRPDQRFSLHVVPIREAGKAITSVWIAGEVLGTLQEFGSGATAAIEFPGGGAGATSATINKGERGFLIKVPVKPTEGPLDVRARLTPATGTIDIPLTDGAKIEAPPTSAQPLLFRRGLSTGNRMQPVAAFQFSRTDRLHLELPIAADATPGAARFLDRNAQPLQVPVQTGEKKDEDGQRWLTADATLSALGAGDYVIEVTYTAGGTEQKILTAIRVTR